MVIGLKEVSEITAEPVPFSFSVNVPKLAVTTWIANEAFAPW